MTAFTTRRAQEGDIPAIAALYRELYDVLGGMAFPFALNDAALPEILAVLIQSKLCFVAVAEGPDGRLAGFVSASMSRLDRKLSQGSQFVGKIADICVTETARRGRLASVLLKEAEDWLRESGCAYVECNISLENLPSRAFFGKHGYAEFSLLGVKKL